MDSQYTTGKYWEENSSMLEDDSDFKFDHFCKLLNRNKVVNPSGVIYMGCGAGRIIWNFSKEYLNINCKGIDLSERVITYAKHRYSNDNLSFELQSSGEIGNEMASYRRLDYCGSLISRSILNIMPHFNKCKSPSSFLYSA